MLAADLQPGDTYQEHDWMLHVLRAWPDVRGIAVVVEEFPQTVLHFPLAALLQVER
jgi:hypothetical protein